MKGLRIFDAEADGLVEEMTKHHCILFKKWHENEYDLYIDFDHPEAEAAAKYAQQRADEVKAVLNIYPFSEFNDRVTTYKAIACHNMFGYDMRSFKKMFGTEYDMFKDKECRGTINGVRVDMYDTLSMSRTLFPDRPLPPGCPHMVKNPITNKMKPVGPHGLEAWGVRVANLKVSIDDWRGLPLWKYVERVWEDVTINEMVWDRLMLEASCKDNPEDMKFVYTDEPKGNQMINWKNALRRGMLTDYLMIEQEIQGVVFDVEKAKALIIRIDKLMGEIEDEVEPQLPKKEMSASAQPNFPAKPFKDNGEISGDGWRWLEKLEYPVDRDALTFKGPPKKCFNAKGELTKIAIKYCNDNEITDEAEMPDFIRKQQDYENNAKVLPDELMEGALYDLRNQTMPDIMIPMKISNQNDIKKYLIRDAGWLPTLWRVKDATKDQFKKKRSDAEIASLVAQYIEELAVSEYKSLILKHLNLQDDKFNMSERRFDNRDQSDYVFKKFLRKARQLPTSPQLRDAVTKQLCPNLERVDGQMAKRIVMWLSARNRRSVLDPIDEDKNDTGLLNHPRLLVDGKLPARFSGITNTGRRKHTICANMPKPDPKVLFGKEMRELWTVPEGHYQVGIDGSNLEGMVAAWGAYEFDGGEYLRIMESDDNHARNAAAYSRVCGRTVGRGEGKGPTYAIMYGGQAAKIAALLIVSRETGQMVIDAFWDNNPGLKGRKEWLERFYEATGRRFIPGLDGRKIWCRSSHSLLNAFQQNGGAALFDLVGILLHWQLVKKGWYDQGVRRTIYYHDEYQLQVPNHFRKTWYFDTLQEADAFMDACKAKKMVMDGHKYKKPLKDEDGNEMKDQNGDTIYKGVFNEEGKIMIRYCPVGEMVVHCVEKAAQMMKSPVHITGEYLTGQNWSDCH